MIKSRNKSLEIYEFFWYNSYSLCKGVSSRLVPRSNNIFFEFIEKLQKIVWKINFRKLYLLQSAAGLYFLHQKFMEAWQIHGILVLWVHYSKIIFVILGGSGLCWIVMMLWVLMHQFFSIQKYGKHPVMLQGL